MSRIYFQETQKFRQVWIWALIFLATILWFLQFIIQIFLHKPVGNNPAPDLVIILVGVIPVGVILLLRFAKLEVIVRRDGIYYRFFPFIYKFKIIHKEELESYEVRKYNAIRDYGGWGIRTGFLHKGSALNVKGNMGVLFTFKKGKKMLIGSQKAEEFKAAIDKAFGPHSEFTE